MTQQTYELHREEPASRARDAWLDLLRAIAITVVVVYHVINMLPRVEPSLWQFAVHGQLGVDLFFVLSGWLIGGLYWRELGVNGRVALLHFWQRRWWRTIPSYAVALLLSWLAAYVARRQPFDWAYCFFLQNYRTSLPFFVVSWSLCIEEHAYLILPLLLWVTARFGRSYNLLLAALAASPLFFRLMNMESARTAEFGYAVTATHFRIEGIVLGFWASYACVMHPESWRGWQRRARMGSPLLLALTALAIMAKGDLAYVLGPSLVAVSCLAILAAGVGLPAGAIARSRWVRWVSLSSYSVYLTHALTLHVARSVAARVSDVWQTPVYVLTALASIAAIGFAFYAGVEKLSLQLRERFNPRRTSPKFGEGALLPGETTP